MPCWFSWRPPQQRRCWEGSLVREVLAQPCLLRADKNANCEDAQVRFQEIQNAWEVLSDPQVRGAARMPDNRDAALSFN